jgi:hypothetical protein
VKKNNILQVFSSSFWGGGELYVYDLSKRLIEDHHKVICISKKSRIIADKLESANIPYYNLPLCGVFDLFSARHFNPFPHCRFNTRVLYRVNPLINSDLFR